LQDSYGHEYMPCPRTIKGWGGCLEASGFFCIWAVWVREWYAHFPFHVQVCHYPILTIWYQFIAMKDSCNLTAQDVGTLALWVMTAWTLILKHVHISFCQGWELVRFRVDSSLTDHLFQVNTMDNVFLILFDTLVVVVTLYNTLGLVIRSREFQMLPQKSLSQTLAEQGRLFHHYIVK
jgi:hypothetical protein